MNCEQAIEYIHSLEKFGIKLGLERVTKLCKAVGDPQKKLRFIHVAGTNGKGSTSTMISNVLIDSGFNTGLFISPYVSDFRERIQFNGNMISPDDLADCVEKVKLVVDDMPSDRPTEFEVITVASFIYFLKKKCDFVVLEVGLGGRYDSTNVIPFALVNVLTNISLDHVAILGNTVDKIAYEKCGIIKKDSITVSYPFQYDESLNVIKKICDDRNSRLIVPCVDKLNVIEEKIDGTYVKYKDVDFKLALAGKHMIYNAITAFEAVKALQYYGVEISDKNISEGISKTVMPARLEIIKSAPLTILDGGHNEGCAAAIADYINKYLRDKRKVILSSLMIDKDAESFLELVVSHADEFIATKANVPRALSSKDLKMKAEKYCAVCHDIPDPHSALNYAEERIKSDDILLVCGSFYLAGELRKDLLNM